MDGCSNPNPYTARTISECRDNCSKDLIIIIIRHQLMSEKRNSNKSPEKLVKGEIRIATDFVPLATIFLKIEIIVSYKTSQVDHYNCGQLRYCDFLVTRHDDGVVFLYSAYFCDVLLKTKFYLHIFRLDYNWVLFIFVIYISQVNNYAIITKSTIQ